MAPGVQYKYILKNMTIQCYIFKALGGVVLLQQLKVSFFYFIAAAVEGIFLFSRPGKARGGSINSLVIDSLIN